MSAAALADVKILLFDVDGIMTDNGLYVDESGRMSKRFDIRDGTGLKLARLAGFEVGIISGHDSEAVRMRARQLGIERCYTGVGDKLPVFESILKRDGFKPRQALFMGDDLLDIPVLQRSGFAVTVPEAAALVKRDCNYITEAPGGRGAVREAVEFVLKERGLYDDVVARYLAP